MKTLNCSVKYDLNIHQISFLKFKIFPHFNDVDVRKFNKYDWNSIKKYDEIIITNKYVLQHKAQNLMKRLEFNPCINKKRKLLNQNFNH